MLRAVDSVLAAMRRLEEEAKDRGKPFTEVPPLSVILVLPLWPHSSAIRTARASRFCRGELVIGRAEEDGQGKHAYLDGFQHCCDASKRQQVQATGRASLLLWLQNDTGYSRWPPSKEALGEVEAAWRAFE